jgi:tetratricopeptide (TPR) repeat protein
MLRKLEMYEKAANTLKEILTKDPLDFRVANEYYLLAKESGDEMKAEKKLEWLNVKMRDYNQNYLELAALYLNDGLVGEAEEILLRFNGKDPIISYYLGYLSDLQGNNKTAEQYFTSASAQSVDYCFPFRLETIKVLETALKYNPSDGKAYYYIGNILFNKQPGKAIEYWEKAVDYEPGLAIGYRNLGWGYYHHMDNGKKAIAAYEKAMAVEKDDPMYYLELDKLYELDNAPIDTRLRLFEGNNAAVIKREDAFARQIGVLTLAGKAEKAVEYLSDKAFTFNEGSQEVYDVVADAHLVLGIQQLNDKKYKEAQETFTLAEVPEELGFFSDAGNRNIQVNYYVGLVHEALGEKSKAMKQYKDNVEMNEGSSSYIKYYKGLSFAKLGKTKEANEIFNSLILEAEEEINKKATDEVDYFAKFGAQETENARLSQAYLIKGLGHNGLGQQKQAKELLKKAVEHSSSNLYATVEYRNL